MKPTLTNLKPSLNNSLNNQEQIKNIQQEVVSLTPKINYEENKDFLENIKSAIQEVSNNQMNSAELTKNFELGIENDLTKVMIQQQIASLGFK